MFYYITPAIDEAGKTDLTLFRVAFPDATQLIAFGNYRAKYGLDEAMSLFRQITYHWVEGATNPIGDIMGGNLFSVRAATLIRTFRGDYHFFEPITIENTPAYHISPKYINSLSDNLDLFYSETYRRAMIVSDRFKKMWEDAGLSGAAFDDVLRPGKY